MRQRPIRRFAPALIVLLSVAVRANSPENTMLVTPAWLAQHAKDPDVVLLHVGEPAGYEAGHIPGARFAALREVSRAPSDHNTLTLEMSPPDVLRSQLEALGISDGSHVIVYFAKDWVSPATRVVFTLLYAGLPRVSLLDGGMDAWSKEGRALTAEAPSAVAGKLSPLKMKPLVVDAEFVRTHSAAPGFAVVDARATAFYDGTQEGGPRDRRKAGHIPGALSVPFTEMVTPDLRWKSADELAAAFRKAGVRDGDTVITYCHIGQQATATLFGAMAAGHEVLLYDGSFEDWARRDLPVDNPAKK